MSHAVRIACVAFLVLTAAGCGGSTAKPAVQSLDVLFKPIGRFAQRAEITIAEILRLRAAPVADDAAKTIVRSFDENLGSVTASFRGHVYDLPESSISDIVNTTSCAVLDYRIENGEMPTVGQIDDMLISYLASLGLRAVVGGTVAMANDIYTASKNIYESKERDHVYFFSRMSYYCATR